VPDTKHEVVKEEAVEIVREPISAAKHGKRQKNVREDFVHT
jgi:hypothetical protein